MSRRYAIICFISVLATVSLATSSIDQTEIQAGIEEGQVFRLDLTLTSLTGKYGFCDPARETNLDFGFSFAKIENVNIEWSGYIFAGEADC